MTIQKYLRRYKLEATVGTLRTFSNEQATCIERLAEENAELKAYNEKLLDSDIEKHNKIVELLKENIGIMYLQACVEKKLTEAKELIRNLLRVTYGEGRNYSLDWKVKAEEFIKEISE